VKACEICEEKKKGSEVCEDQNPSIANSNESQNGAQSAIRSIASIPDSGTEKNKKREKNRS